MPVRRKAPPTTRARTVTTRATTKPASRTIRNESKARAAAVGKRSRKAVTTTRASSATTKAKSAKATGAKKKKRHGDVLGLSGANPPKRKVASAGKRALRPEPTRRRTGLEYLTRARVTGIDVGPGGEV
jgi:hypothetical protein